MQCCKSISVLAKFKSCLGKFVYIIGQILIYKWTNIDQIIKPESLHLRLQVLPLISKTSASASLNLSFVDQGL